ncbi:PP2C family protein-serine/threonine phosphatase [Acrocarpospora catenulata]|uniref:PP2C family protein-serine/threonine phosphatase n=1 Tax=Acrocarpospora catenulata TaxID=2836182 RepID=UPI001BD96C2D|nr:PP2C family protein-serine/threonine phosphatase [Acrocarpospora catenulata]
MPVPNRLSGLFSPRRGRRRAAGARTATALAVLPFLVMFIVTVVDAVTGPEQGFLPLMAVGPAFASLTGGVRRTLIVGLTALVLAIALAVYNDLELTRAYVTCGSIAGVTAASALASVGRRRREKELASMRSVAEVAQRVLLRPVPRRAAHMRMAVSYTSAMAAAHIGGDLYEVVNAPTGVRVIIGDVQGKGLEAVETAALVLGAFREAAHDEKDLQGVSARLEKALNRRLSGEEFVTAVLAEANPDEPTVTLLNYGHPAPLVIRANGEIEFAEPEDHVPPLGLAALGPEGPSPYGVTFQPGDQILLYTDGVVEARDHGGAFYPLADRVSLLKDDDPEAALEALRRDLILHIDGPPKDDAAMLLLRCRDPEPPTDSSSPQAL